VGRLRETPRNVESRGRKKRSSRFARRGGGIEQSKGGRITLLREKRKVRDEHFESDPGEQGKIIKGRGNCRNILRRHGKYDFHIGW